MANRRQRRDFTEAFKAQAVRLVRESGKTVSAVARELDLTESACASGSAMPSGRPAAPARSVTASARSWSNCGARSRRCGWSATS